jgi:hypothetical protein
VHNESFNVGIDRENYRIRDLAEIVRETVPDCRIDYATDAGPDLRCYRVDFGKYGRSFPGFPLRWDARRGTGQIYESYRTFGLKKEEFEGARYQRIAHIKELLASGALGEDLRWNEEAHSTRS